MVLDARMVWKDLLLETWISYPDAADCFCQDVCKVYLFCFPLSDFTVAGLMVMVVIVSCGRVLAVSAILQVIFAIPGPVIVIKPFFLSIVATFLLDDLKV